MNFDEVKRRHPLRDVLPSLGIRILPGDRFRCFLPGHEDRDPSADVFVADDGTERWQCHTCGQGGDVFDALAAIKGLDHAEAMAWLGERPATRRDKPLPEALLLDLPPASAPPILAGRESPPIWSVRAGKTMTYTPAMVHKVQDMDGFLHGYILRIEKGDGSKIPLPVRWDRLKARYVAKGWNKAVAAPPLYGAVELQRRPGVQVLLVEGEKCKDVAQAVLADWVVVSWHGGTAAMAKQDWTLLEGRDVTFWPDADANGLGQGKMLALAKRLKTSRSWWLEPSKDWLSRGRGYDVADLLKDEGVEAVRTFLSDRAAIEPPGFNSGGDLPSWTYVSAGGWFPDDEHRELVKDGSDIAVKSESNLYLCLHYHPAFASLSFDVVTRELLFRGQPIDEAAMYRLRGMVNEMARLSPPLTAVEKAVEAVCHEREVNRLKDRLRAIEWDGVYRWLGNYVGVEETPWAMAALDRWPVGLVRRVIEPGTKHDIMLVLEGEQGVKKTTALEVLASPFGFDGYTQLERLTATGSDVMKLDGKIVIEVSEMRAYRKADQEHFKSFLTSHTDRYRQPYAKRFINVKRCCVFAGTTNNVDNYLTDPSGNRRIAPVRVAKRMDLAKLERDLPQLYAQWLTRLDGLAARGQEINWFTESEEELQKAETGQREAAPVFTARLMDILDGRACGYIDDDELWFLCGLGEMRDRHAFRESMREEMRRLGWAQNRRMIHGERKRGRWWRLKN